MEFDIRVQPKAGRNSVANEPELQNYQYKNGVDSQIITLERSIP